MLAMSKLNSLEEKFSRAINDGEITKEEFPTGSKKLREHEFRYSKRVQV